MEKVLLMMNAPTNIATPAKISMNMLNDEMLSWSAFWSSATSAAPVTTSTSRPGPRPRRSAAGAPPEPLRQGALRDAVLRGERDAVHPSGSGEHGLRGGVGEQHRR